MNDLLMRTVVYLEGGAVTLLGTAVLMLMRGGIKKAEGYVTAHLQPTQATHVNDLLETIDRLAEATVQDMNSRIVCDLKTKAKFDAVTAASVKEAAVNAVLANLGALQEQAAAVLGDLPQIVGQVVEKHVVQAKEQNKTPA